MKEYKGTRGNWKVGAMGAVISDDATQITKIDAKRGHDEVEYYGGVLVCESIRKNEDGKLIAAAPELLKALQIIFSSKNEIISDMNFCRDGNGDDMEWKFDEIEKAIKKALE